MSLLSPISDTPSMKKRGNPSIQERFGLAVKTLREKQNLTQEELAHRAGLHRTYLSDIERGFRNPSLINIEKLALALDTPLPALFAHTCELTR